MNILVLWFWSQLHTILKLFYFVTLGCWSQVWLRSSLCRSQSTTDNKWRWVTRVKSSNSNGWIASAFSSIRAVETRRTLFWSRGIIVRWCSCWCSRWWRQLDGGTQAGRRINVWKYDLPRARSCNFHYSILLKFAFEVNDTAVFVTNDAH